MMMLYIKKIFWLKKKQQFEIRKKIMTQLDITVKLFFSLLLFIFFVFCVFLRDCFGVFFTPNNPSSQPTNQPMRRWKVFSLIIFSHLTVLPFLLLYSRNFHIFPLNFISGSYFFRVAISFFFFIYFFHLRVFVYFYNANNFLVKMFHFLFWVRNLLYI